MSFVIERGAQFQVRGSDSTIEVVDFNPGSSVTYHVVEPIPTPALLKLTEDEFKAYVIDPETGMTEKETRTAEQAAFDSERSGLDLEHNKDIEEADRKHQERESAASQKAIDSGHADAVERAKQAKQRDAGARATLMDSQGEKLNEDETRGEDDEHGKKKKGRQEQGAQP